MPADTKTIHPGTGNHAPVMIPSPGTSPKTPDQPKHYEKVTLETLAGRLGLSVATISKALSGKGRIGEETRLKIRRLADDLGYVPNIMARSLQREASDTVGLLLLGDITNPWHSKIVSFLSERLEELGRTMMLSVCSGNPMRLRHAVASFIGGSVQGIIAGPVADDATMEQFRPALARHLPIVFFGNLRPIPQNFVTPDQEYGGYLATEFLVSLGHRRIAFASWNDDEISVPGTRFRGYSEQMKRHGLKPQLIFSNQTKISRHGAYCLACEKIVVLPPEQRPTAIFCHNDDMALGIMMALQQHGIRIPDDISIMGFDDIDEAAFAYPNLTTIGGIKEIYPARLCQTLLKAISAPQEILAQQYIRPELVIRQSTAAPRVP